MQYKIARILNHTLLLFAGLVALLGLGYVLVSRLVPDIKYYYLVGFVVTCVLAVIAIFWLEQVWDKKVITRMAKEGHIALADIHGSERVLPMRDSTFTRYWLYKFEATIYDASLQGFRKTFYEKMNCESDSLPCGTVYVTYDAAKPNQIFIVPNVLISHMPNLIPIVAAYEGAKNIPVKYLDAYYNKGMVLKTFRDSLELQRRARQKKGEAKS